MHLALQQFLSNMVDRTGEKQFLQILNKTFHGEAKPKDKRIRLRRPGKRPSDLSQLFAQFPSTAREHIIAIYDLVNGDRSKAAELLKSAGAPVEQ